MKITDKQREICENRDWTVRTCEDGEIEIESWSPAGENILFYVYEDDGTFVDGVKRIAAEFDPEDHAELYIRIRGTNGVPNSIRELLDDADAIDKMLQDLAAALAETEEVE